MDLQSANCSSIGRHFAYVNHAAIKPASASEARREERTHLFVSASLYCGVGSAPVHIRNMSASGALIEAPLLPEPGSRVVLRRGSLQVAGHVAWQVNRRAGVAFDGLIHVSDWMARTASTGQVRVDEIVAGFKAGSGHSPVPAAPSNDRSDTTTIEADLAAIRADLLALSETLVSDAIVAATHPEIQTLDITLQRVDRMLAKLRQAA